MEKLSTSVSAAALALSLHCGCTSLVVPEEIETLKVYESGEKPGHNQWPTAFLDNQGNLCVIFQNISGDLKQEPSYAYRERSGDYRISRIGMKYDPERRKFRQIWQTLGNEAYFCIMAPQAAPSGKNLGICSAEAFPKLKTEPGSVVIAETSDCGKTFTPLAAVSLPDTELCPNDIRFIGKDVYFTAYDGNGGVYLSVSGDEGRTWTRPFKFAESHDNMSFHEPSIAGLANGNILIVMRTHRMDIPKHNGINYHMLTLSPCGPGNWKVSGLQDTGFGFRGRPYLLRTRENILILACPGHFMAFSLNDGRTWSPAHTIFTFPG